MTRTQDRNIGYVVRNPRWGAEDQTSVLCRVKFAHMPEEIFFTATAADSERQSRDIFRRAAAGEFGEVAPFEPPAPRPPVSAKAIEALRAFSKSPAEQVLVDGIAPPEGASAPENGRGIAAYAEAVLSERLAAVLGKSDMPSSQAKSLSFSEKVKTARSLALISAREAVALDLIENIKTEIIQGADGSFKTDYVRIYVNCLHACLAKDMTYNPTDTVEDDWIDLIFLDAYTLLSESLAARANPKVVARLVE